MTTVTTAETEQSRLKSTRTNFWCRARRLVSYSASTFPVLILQTIAANETSPSLRCMFHGIYDTKVRLFRLDAINSLYRYRLRSFNSAALVGRRRIVCK